MYCCYDSDAHNFQRRICLNSSSSAFVYLDSTHTSFKRATFFHRVYCFKLHFFLPQQIVTCYSQWPLSSMDKFQNIIELYLYNQHKWFLSRNCVVPMGDAQGGVLCGCDVTDTTCPVWLMDADWNTSSCDLQFFENEPGRNFLDLICLTLSYSKWTFRHFRTLGHLNGPSSSNIDHRDLSMVPFNSELNSTHF